MESSRSKTTIEIKKKKSNVDKNNQKIIPEMYDFKKLTPNKEVDIKVYEEAINFVYDNNDLRNIAIAGQYGSGKSSILESYKRKYEKRKFLHVSVAHFENNSTKKNPDEEDHSSILEWKILNQLIHQIDPERIKISKFKTKKNHKLWNKHIMLATYLFGSLILVALYVARFSKVKKFVGTIVNTKYFNNFIDFFAKETTLVFAVVLLVFQIFIRIYYLLYLQKNNMLFKKIKVKDNEIEMFKEDNDSYFDHYLNEVLYIFENIEEEIIVFEDIDRFNDSGIFERLHEINRLVNYQRKEDKIIRFFYLIKDDVFISRDRTKFFDFIIPVVPVADSSNAQDILLRYFKDTRMNSNIDARFIQDVSLYLDDMRIIKNIFNEFLIYNARLKGSNLNKTKLLAMITYKNLFPRDFSDLRLNSGLVYSIFDQKNLLVENQIKQLEKNILTYKEDIEIIKNEVAKSKEELKAIYLKLYPKRYYTSEIQDDKVDEYKRRESLIEREEDVESLNHKILKIKEKISELTVYSLRHVLSKDNIEDYFNDIEYTNALNELNNFRDVKTNKYFDLLKYLIRNGYIDESYPDYMSYFYAESTTWEDKKFLRSIADQEKLDPNYNLIKPEKILENMDRLTIGQEEAQNYDLLEYMLKKDYIPKHKELLVYFFLKIKEDSNYDFIYQFFNKKKLSRTKLVKHLTNGWNDFWNDVYLNNRLDEEFVRQFTIQLLINDADLSDITYNIDENLSRYISNNENYLDISGLSDDEEIKIIESLKKHEIKFIKIVNANSTLLSQIYSNNLYELTQNNVNLMMQEFYRNNEGIHTYKNYSVIMSQNNSYLAKYVTSNKEKYLSYLLEETNVEFSDEIKWYLDIVNDENLTSKTREDYINRSKVKIESLIDIIDVEFWSSIISRNQAVYNEINLYDYYVNVGNEELFAFYVNENIYELKISEVLGEKENYFSFFEFSVSNNYINNDKYIQFIESFSSLIDELTNEDIADEKINILINLEKIKMNEKNLVFVRENYSNNLLHFIDKNLESYIDILSKNSDLVIQEELEKTLMLNLDDNTIEEILNLSPKSINIKKKEYNDNVLSLILDKHYNKDELPYFFEKYEKFNTTVKSKINNIAIKNENILIHNLDTTSKCLILDLLKSVYVEMKKDDKLQMFIKTIQLFNQNEISELFETLNLESFVDFFDFKKRRIITLEINELNKSILDSLKSADLICDYNPIKDKNYYSVRRKNKN